MSNPASRRERSEVVINIRDAVKKYGGNTVISGLSLHIEGGEFFTLLGPSGCGKTTLLRMIAGFNTIEGGDFYFNDTRINDLDPAKRNIGMVFQNYAIFPHMNVRKNVEFGLKNRDFDRSKIHDQADRFLKLMQIDQLADRMPAQLSGGQQQRVALARALCIEPQVLLMDEPLSNLDAKLRVEMRTAIKEIQNHVGITTVYVTHDQEEAMAVSDRIAVMNAGVIQHVGTPKNIYQRPANVFVATFIGRSNMMEGTLHVEDGPEGGPRAVVEMPTGYRAVFNNVLPENLKEQKVKVCARPEELLLENDGEGLSAVVDDCVFLGLNTHYFAHLTSGEKVEVIQESTIDSIIEPGTAVRLRLNTDKANLFSEDGSRNLLAGVENDLVSLKK